MYCTNVHKSEDFGQMLQVLNGPVAEVAKNVSPGRKYDIGLRISNSCAEKLVNDLEAFDLFVQTLKCNGLDTRHINGFPYGDFHARKVKEDAYLPDWRSQERVDYTIGIAHILSKLTSPGETATITTVPLAYKGTIGTDKMLANLEKAERFLSSLHERTGKKIILAIEPEPDCLVEDLHSFLRFIRPAPYRGVCIDTCHAAVIGEPLDLIFDEYSRAGVNIARIQISAAVVALNEEAISPFLADDVYLHQRRGNRIHFHVPLYWDGDGDIATTRDTITSSFLRKAISCGIPLEIETYTYDVLPETLRPSSVVDMIVKEELWLRKRLKEL